MGAVQNAMQRDGLDPTIMDLDPDKSVASQLKKEEDDGPPLKDDPKYQKYFKVRRVFLFLCLNFSDYCLHRYFYFWINVTPTPEDVKNGM